LQFWYYNKVLVIRISESGGGGANKALDPYFVSIIICDRYRSPRFGYYLDSWQIKWLSSTELTVNRVVLDSSLADQHVPQKRGLLGPGRAKPNGYNVQYHNCAPPIYPLFLWQIVVSFLEAFMQTFTTSGSGFSVCHISVFSCYERAQRRLAFLSIYYSLRP
jgi:hypothetical protein